MRLGYAWCLTAIIIVLICASTYLYVNRFTIITLNNVAYVHDRVTKNIKVVTRGYKEEEKPTINVADAERRKLSKKVNISASYSSGACSEKYPVHITVTNNTDRKILYTTFFLDVRVRGKSSSLVSKQEQDIEYHYDEIVEPGYTVAGCFAMPNLSQEYKSSEMEVVPFGAAYTFWGIPAGNLDALMRFGAFSSDSNS